MSVNPIVVRLDAEQIIPRDLTAIYQTISIQETNAIAYKSGVHVDPYSNILMITPLQMLANSYTNTDIVRNGIEKWTLTAAHWEEVRRSSEKWLLSDGTIEEIESTEVFPKDSGFYLQFFLFGARNDVYPGLELTFGQWKLTIRSDGLTFLYHGVEEFHRAAANLALSGEARFSDQLVELMIMPCSDGRLFIRRNGMAGFFYKLTPDDLNTDQGIIEEGSFTLKVSTANARVRFELTQLKWPETLTGYYYVTPNMTFPYPPATGQSVAVEVSADIPGNGGYVAAIYEPMVDGDTYATLAAFVPDDTKTEYCIGISMVGDSTFNSSTMITKLTVSADPTGGSAPTDPTDITHDIARLSINTGESVTDTTATFEIVNPENHPIFGKCNRHCTITTLDNTIFEGMLKDPPRYSRTIDGDRYYSCEAMTLAKWLLEPCLTNAIIFDGMIHTEAITWLCKLAGIPETMLDFDTDTSTLPNEQKQSSDGEVKYQFQPNFADTPMDWIEQICDITGWQFTDGYDISGNYVFKYIDPLALPTTVIKGFTLIAADETDYYQRVYSWEPYSLEPEANEIYIMTKDQYGQIIAGRYWDRQSQDATMVEPPAGEGETERPDNWIGYRRLLVDATIDYPVTDQQLMAIALRAGMELCERRDILVMEAAYPIGLWSGDVISVYDSSATKQPYISDVSGVSYFRIWNISNIEFINEWADYPDRRAQYELVKIGDYVAP